MGPGEAEGPYAGLWSAQSGPHIPHPRVTGEETKADTGEETSQETVTFDPLPLSESSPWLSDTLLCVCAFRVEGQGAERGLCVQRRTWMGG